MTQSHFGDFTLIHQGFNPWVSPDRSNDCQVFQPRSNGSDKFLTCAFSHEFLVMEKSMVQMFSWTLGIYDPDLFATHEDTERPSCKAFNTLLSPTNLTVVCNRRFPDGISFIDQNLFKVKVLNLPASSSDLTAVSDHISPDGISSVDSTLIRDKALNTPSSSSDLTVVSDHRSPDKISSVDSILHPYVAISGFQEDRSSLCRVTKALPLHILFPSS